MTVAMIGAAASLISVILFAVLAFGGLYQLGLLREQLRGTREDEKKRVSLGVCDRFDTDPILEKAADAVSNYHLYNGRRGEAGIYRDIAVLLRFFDTMAIGIRQDLYVEEILAAHLRDDVHRVVELYRTACTARFRAEKDYAALLELDRRWQAGEAAPVRRDWFRAERISARTELLASARRAGEPLFARTEERQPLLKGAHMNGGTRMSEPDTDRSGMPSASYGYAWRTESRQAANGAARPAMGAHKSTGEAKTPQAPATSSWLFPSPRPAPVPAKAAPNAVADSGPSSGASAQAASWLYRAPVKKAQALRPAAQAKTPPPQSAPQSASQTGWLYRKPATTQEAGPAAQRQQSEVEASWVFRLAAKRDAQEPAAQEKVSVLSWLRHAGLSAPRKADDAARDPAPISAPDPATAETSWLFRKRAPEASASNANPAAAAAGWLYRKASDAVAPAATPIIETRENDEMSPASGPAAFLGWLFSTGNPAPSNNAAPSKNAAGAMPAPEPAPVGPEPTDGAARAAAFVKSLFAKPEADKPVANAPAARPAAALARPAGSSWIYGAATAQAQKAAASPQAAPQPAPQPSGYLYRAAAPQPQRQPKPTAPAAPAKPLSAGSSWVFRGQQASVARPAEKTASAPAKAQAPARSWLFPAAAGAPATPAPKAEAAPAKPAAPQQSWLYRGSAPAKPAAPAPTARATAPAKPAAPQSSWLYRAAQATPARPAAPAPKPAPQTAARPAETSGQVQSTWLFRAPAAPAQMARPQTATASAAPAAKAAPEKPVTQSSWLFRAEPSAPARPAIPASRIAASHAPAAKAPAAKTPAAAAPAKPAQKAGATQSSWLFRAAPAVPAGTAKPAAKAAAPAQRQAAPKTPEKPAAPAGPAEAPASWLIRSNGFTNGLSTTGPAAPKPKPPHSNGEIKRPEAPAGIFMRPAPQASGAGINGASANGHAMNGARANGRAMNGHNGVSRQAAGQAAGMNGSAANGSAANGHAANGTHVNGMSWLFPAAAAEPAGKREEPQEKAPDSPAPARASWLYRQPLAR